MINIYTDGSFRRKQGAAASSIVVVFDDGSIQIDHQYLGLQTNNYAELYAIKLALLWCIKFKLTNEKILINSDSTYAIGTAIEEIDSNADKESSNDVVELRRQFSNLSFKWVKGHSTNRYNRIADTVANIAIDQKHNLIKNYC